MIVFDVLKFYCVASPTEVERAWWLSRTSNPVRWVNSLAGGFDSHALPPFFSLVPRAPAGGFSTSFLPPNGQSPDKATETATSTRLRLSLHKFHFRGVKCSVLFNSLMSRLVNSV